MQGYKRLSCRPLKVFLPKANFITTKYHLNNNIISVRKEVALSSNNNNNVAAYQTRFTLYSSNDKPT